MCAYESGYKSILAAKLDPADTSMTVAEAPTITAGRLYLKSWSQEEWIAFTGVSGTTITGLTRGLSQTADPATAGTGLTWIAGTAVKLVAMHDQIDDKANATTITGAKTFTGSNLVSGASARRDMSAALWGASLPNLTTAQRTALTAENGDICYDTDLGNTYVYESGSWVAVDTGSAISNASETVAGIVELATQAEADAGTDTGATGAKLAVVPSYLKQSVTGATAKTTLVDADEVSIADSAASNINKKITYANFKTAIWWFPKEVMTFTSGEAIDAWEALYLKNSDWKVYLADASDLTKMNFIGIANTTVWAADLDVIVNVSGVDDTQTGMTVWNELYLTDTPWAISTSSGTYVQKVGTAVTATGLQLFTGRSELDTLKSQALWSWGYSYDSTGILADADATVYIDITTVWASSAGSVVLYVWATSSPTTVIAYTTETIRYLHWHIKKWWYWRYVISANANTTSGTATIYYQQDH